MRVRQNPFFDDYVSFYENDRESRKIPDASGKSFTSPACMHIRFVS